MGRLVTSQPPLAGVSGTSSVAESPAPEPFWVTPANQLLSQLSTDGKGLSSAEASRRLRQYGPNELARSSRLLELLATARRVMNPLVLILLVASLVSAFVGEFVNAVIIVLMVVASSAPVGFMAFLLGAVVSYLVIVEVAKRAFYRWHPLS